MISEFDAMPDMDEPKPANDFEVYALADPQLYLYNLYGNHVFESVEEFVARMQVRHGDDWINLLIRK